MTIIRMNFRRYYIPDSIVFITQVVQERLPIFTNQQHVQLLRDILHNVKAIHPFSMVAYVFLPDHLHLMIRPTGDSNFSQIMHSFKRNFTVAYKERLSIDRPIKFWQKRFWDHIIRDENDFGRHLDYIHFNPVKHGLVMKPELWLPSSFLLWKARGVYEDEWGWVEPDSIREMGAVQGE